MEKSKIRLQIIEYATSAFMANGVKAVKMDSISSALGISKRTLYEIFDNKEVLLEECIVKSQHDYDAMMQQIYADANGDLLKVLVSIFKFQVERIMKINPALYDDLLLYPELVKRMERSRNDNDAKIRNFFSEGVKQGIFRDTVNYQLIIESFKNHSAAIASQKLYKRYPMIDLFNSFTMVVFRGLVTESALKRFEALYNL